jgi:hypothetical protein
MANLIETYYKPVAVGVSIVLLVGMLSLYNDVQANTAYRLSGEQKDKVLLEMRDVVIRMEQDLKYIRKDVDDLKVSQKELSVSLQEDRDRVLRPWMNQSKAE